MLYVIKVSENDKDAGQSGNGKKLVIIDRIEKKTNSQVKD